MFSDNPLIVELNISMNIIILLQVHDFFIETKHLSL